MNTGNRWDIFCTVVDNYGDIGVCWRLARQLATERGHSVRLWLDSLPSLCRLVPEARSDTPSQWLDQVEVRHWPGEFPDTSAADVVVEAFACELPPNYLKAMTQHATPPVWINLEYLSAEPWIEEVHRLGSPHPSLPLTKHFFFPGFTKQSGGLIREVGIGPGCPEADVGPLRERLGLTEAPDAELTVSLFAYENAAITGLLDIWSRSDRPICCLVPEGRQRANVLASLGMPGNHEGLCRHGNLTIHLIPFLPQRDYDTLLRMADLNFVRGEDSFVRAQWAMHPFVWQIYPQAGDAHWTKLEAFLDRYLANLPVAAAEACKSFWQAWNEQGDAAAAWYDFATALPILAGHAVPWAEKLAEAGDLATNLEKFAGSILA